jgi:hypothetical protein
MSAPRNVPRHFTLLQVRNIFDIEEHPRGFCT